MLTLHWTHWLCGAQLSAPEEKSGARVRCPRCKQAVRVPLTPALKAEERQRSRTRKRAEREHRIALVRAKVDAAHEAAARSAPDCPLCRRTKMETGKRTRTDGGRVFAAVLVFFLFGGMFFCVITGGLLSLAVSSGSASAGSAIVFWGSILTTVLLIWGLWKSTQVEFEVWECPSCGHCASAGHDLASLSRRSTRSI